MREPTLSDMQAFLAVAHNQSFRQAADQLRVSPSTLSHTVASLERELGVRLFHRTTRSVALTESGERLSRRMAPILAAYRDAIREADPSRAEPAGTVRINAPEMAVRLLLAEVVPLVLQRHPGVSVDLVVENRLVDVIAEGFDAGVRLGEAVPRDMIAVRFGGDVRFVVVGSPAYLQETPPPVTPEDLASHQCIGHRFSSGRLFRWEFERHGQEVAVDVTGRVTLNAIPLMVEAALAGLGLAYVPERAVRELVAAGALAVVLDDWCPAIPGFFLYYAGHRQLPGALRAFIDVMREVV